mmetsp:Transcript_8711/g.17071  ORF Transcript_8711/g.17071 Transcript_8711/m.17071 type:complete len:99 (-) Transcript_8711:193-489(-)
MCSLRGGGPDFVRLGMVFTPKEHRGWGYASELVGTLCRALLLGEAMTTCTAGGGGVKRVVLWADESNLTSRKVYSSLGFEESEGKLTTVTFTSSAKMA